MGKGAETKDRILERALELISEKGLGSTSISDLLIASGIKKGALYYHFPGKDELCLAVLDLARKRFFEKLEISFAGRSAYQGLLAFMDDVLSGLDSRHCSGGCVFGNTALEKSDISPVYAACVAEFFKSWENRLESVLTEAQKDGDVRKDITADRLAGMLLATIEGAIMLSRVAKDSSALKNSIASLKLFLTAK